MFGPLDERGQKHVGAKLSPIDHRWKSYGVAFGI